MPSAVRHYLERQPGRPDGVNWSPALSTFKEKVQTWVSAGRVSFLPYLDPYTEETPAMRRMYPVMLRNPVAKTALLTKIQSVAALDLQTTPASEQDRDEEISEFVRYSLTDALDLGFPGACEEILLPGLISPPNVVESVWHDSLWPRGRWRGKRMYRGFKSKEFARPLQDEYRNIVGVQASGYGQSQTFGLEDFIVFQNMSLYQGPGMSDMRAAYTAMWELDTVAKLHVIHLEKYIDPYLVATNVDKDYQKALEGELEKAKARRWLIPPDGAIVQAMSLSQKGPAEYLEFCKDRREQITLSIAGAFLQMLTAVSGGDIRGNSRTQQSTSELLVWALAAKLASHLKTSVVPRLVDTNYLGADYPGVSLGGVNYADLKQSVEIENTLQQMGFPLSLKAAARKYSVQKAVDDADTLKRVQNAAPPGMGGGLPFADRPREPRSPASRPKPTDDDEDEPSSFADDVAAAGHDGAQAEKLLHAAVRDGGARLAAVTRSAVARLLADPEKAHKAKRLFDDAEHEALAGTLASVGATGELLGRSRIRRRANQVEARTFADRPRRFSEVPTDLRIFAEPIRVLPPEEALSYFRSLVPDISGEKGFTDRHERTAFTLAGQTDEVLLGKVQDAIAERLATGAAIGTAPADIEAILDAAGAGRGGGYAEMVFRTNAHDSYVVGSQRELAQVTDIFPTWKYANPVDSRSRPSHAEKNGKYYSSDREFTEVRGTGIEDAAQCRCIQLPIDAAEWRELQAEGARIEDD